MIEGPNGTVEGNFSLIVLLRVVDPQYVPKMLPLLHKYKQVPPRSSLMLIEGEQRQSSPVT
jgi:hypothetical protein